ncbi:MAG: DUF3783 domain-containing protein [Lachnospiraceae bacterium]|nr:DUF3783 domain-containing protein [Lachnospiraceae bacterium]
MKPTLLCYHISTQDYDKLKALLALLNFDVRLIPRNDYLQAIGYLAALPGYIRTPEQYTGPEFTESMLIMAHMNDAQADQLLAMLKMPGMPVLKRKVMLTDTNQNWTSAALYDHITAEIAAIRSSNC